MSSSQAPPKQKHFGTYEGAGDWIKYPAAGVRLGTASVIWWADREAAAWAEPDSR